MADLNQAQQKAVEENGALLILAGPGSGKTKVITEKILHLMKTGVKPENILALTFSEKAAKEMSDRLAKETDASQLTISTFHSFCRQILEDNVLDSGISFASGVISRANQLVWGLKSIDSFGLEYAEVGNNEIELIQSMIDGISAFRDELISPEDLETYLQRKEPKDEEEADRIGKLKDMLKIYKEYEKYKRKEMLLDFDDMIHEVSLLFSKKPLILKRYKAEYKYILVDEFQDTNFAQLFLIKQLAGENVFAVGDDDQSIYRFRGAYLTNFQDFKAHFKKYQEILLKQNYRNSRNILGIAMQLMEKAPNRERKDLNTGNHDGEKISVAKCENEQAEAEFVLKEIRNIVGTKFFSRSDQRERTLTYKDIAILSRRKADGVKYNNILRKNGIPSEFVAHVDFFSMPVIRDMEAYLKIIENPLKSGIHLSRIMKISGITEINVQKINEHARKKRSDTDFIDFVFESMEEADNIIVSQKAHVAEIVQTIKKMLELKEKTTISELVYNIMVKYTDLYKKSINEAKNSVLLNKFYEISQDYESIAKKMSIGDFLSYIEMLSSFQTEIGETEETDSVKIMTVHQSKGKEFAVVFIVDAAARKFPLRYAPKDIFVPNDLSKGLKTQEDEKDLYLQEERRLFYVAITRAEQKLYIAFAEQYGDNKNKTKPSQFLEEISYFDNPLIDLILVKSEGKNDITQAPTILEKTIDELQEKCVKAVQQMQLKTAVQKIAELEKLRTLEETGKINFEPEKFFSVEDNDAELKSIIDGKVIPIVKKDQRFSATALDTYKECPLKYKFQSVLLVPTIRKTYFDLGSVVHKVLETLSKKELDGIKPTKEAAMEMLSKFWSSSAYQSRKKELEDKESASKMIDTYLEWQEANKNKIVGVEVPFDFTIGGRRLTGKIDRIEQTGDGEYVVIDYKTGYAKETKNTIKENIQMNVYSLAILEKLFGKLPKQASLFYVKHNKFVDYFPDKNSVDMQKKRLEEMINSVMAEKFGATPSYQACKFCDYSVICDEKEVDD